MNVASPFRTSHVTIKSCYQCNILCLRRQLIRSADQIQLHTITHMCKMIRRDVEEFMCKMIAFESSSIFPLDALYSHNYVFCIAKASKIWRKKKCFSFILLFVGLLGSALFGVTQPPVTPASNAQFLHGKCLKSEASPALSKTPYAA